MELSEEEYVQMVRHGFHLNETKSVVFTDFTNGLLNGFFDLAIDYFSPVLPTKHYVVVDVVNTMIDSIFHDIDVT